MSDLQVEGMALKKLLKLAKKSPLPFGFNPSTKIPECYLAMHRKKPAKMIGKDAKEEGPSEKSAFGTIKVDGKMMVVKCERIVPNLAKTLKKYLKLQKVMLNVEVQDASGTTLESDVEEGLPDDPELDGEDESETGIDKAALAKRLGELRKSIQALDPNVAEKFNGAFAKIVGMFKKDALEKCVKGADQIEAALPKTGGKPAPDPALVKLAELYKQFVKQSANITDETKRGNIIKALGQAATLIKTRKTPEATALLTKIRDAIKNALASNAPLDAPPEIPDAPAPPDPRAAKLAEYLANYTRQLDRVPDDSARKSIEEILKQVSAQINANEFNKATASLTQARDALKAAINAAKVASEKEKAQQRLDEMEEAPQEAVLTGQDAKDFETWTKIHKELSDKITNALTKGLVADVGELRKDWNWSVATAADKKYGEALKSIPKIRKLLEAGTPDGKSVFNEQIPPDVKPFAESRIRWNFARSKMQSEMDKLKSAILSAVKDDEELRKEVNNNIGLLTDHIVKLDDRLEDKLDQIVNEAAGTKRDGFKDEARKLLSEYRNELENEFFQDVDSNSGFGNVSIMSTAQTALGAIETVLQ